MKDVEAAVSAAEAMDGAVAVKLGGDGIAHKTERGLVRLGVRGGAGVRAASEELLALARPEDGVVHLLVAEMIQGQRELIAGLIRDPQFGACVVLGLGGVLAEALEDVTFAALPIDRSEADRMIDRLKQGRVFTEPFRGEPALDRSALVDLLMGLGRLAEERPDIASVDLNPLIVRAGCPIAVDALVELGHDAVSAETQASESDDVIRSRFSPLFHPRGIVVAGVSSHPGKFGFVTLHNLKRFGFEGAIFPVKPDGAEVLGCETLTSVDEVPDGAADMVFVCTPNRANVALLRACAKKGVRAAFIASAGYGEAGEEGRALQEELVAVAEELGMVIIGPNGQGVVSTPAHMCAQIVAPYPPSGSIGIASQSGNLVSSFMNYAVSTGVGVSKAVSLGNSAQVGLAEMLEYFAVDPDTEVALTYVEGVGDGARFRQAASRLTRSKPLVLVKGGASGQGARAAASHTGALASDDRVFDGIARQLGILRAPTVEEAFEWAATLASQPLPRGRRTVVFTTVGGWGVLAADACAAAGLDLIPLPEEILEKIDTMVPARWSRNNPIDLAGGETREILASESRPARHKHSKAVRSIPSMDWSGSPNTTKPKTLDLPKPPGQPQNGTGSRSCRSPNWRFQTRITPARLKCGLGDGSAIPAPIEPCGPSGPWWTGRSSISPDRLATGVNPRGVWPPRFKKRAPKNKRPDSYLYEPGLPGKGISLYV